MQSVELADTQFRLSRLFRQDAAWAFLIALLAFAPYSLTFSHGFSLVDDHLYVTRNYEVQRGLSLECVRSALTSFSTSNWQPVTLMSHALDCRLFGLNARGHHATNVALHSLAAAILFLFLVRLLGDRSKAGLVALLFALHPLQVETVAWISSRKGLLSTLFVFLALWAHAEFALEVRTGRRRFFYLLGLVATGLALASKSMAVTLPLLLLIVDYWPLGRWPLAAASTRREQMRGLGCLVVEKIPHGLLSLGCVTLTLLAHTHERVFHDYSWPARLANLFHSYVVYLQKTVWPSGLSVYYPHAGESFSRWSLALNILIFALLTVFAWRLRRSRPAWTSGWLWYLISLLPVTGLIPIDGNGWADRYAYLPLVGIFWGIVWSIPSGWLESRAGGRRRLATAVASLVIVALGIVTVRQVRLWGTSQTLFEHALLISPANSVTNAWYATALAERSDLTGAERHLRLALRVEPELSWARHQLGTVLFRQHRAREALTEFQRAADAGPLMLEWRSAAASAAAELGDREGARAIWNEILRKDPRQPSAYVGLGLLALNAGDLPAATRQFHLALNISPYYSDAWKGLGYVAKESKQYGEAADLLKKAFDLGGPVDDEDRLQYGRMLTFAGREKQAETVLLQLMRRNPRSPEILGVLALAIASQGRTADAVPLLESLIKLQPNDVVALHSLGRLLAALDRPRDALPYLTRASQLQPDRTGLAADLERVRRKVASVQ